MRRVVITGMGIVSPIGNNVAEVDAALRAGKSGIVASEEMKEHGFRSQVAGTLKIDIKEHVDKRTLRFMGPGAAYAHIAMGQAIEDACQSQRHCRSKDALEAVASRGCLLERSGRQGQCIRGITRARRDNSKGNIITL